MFTARYDKNAYLQNGLSMAWPISAEAPFSPGHVKFMVDKVALGQVFSDLFFFPPVSIIPQLLITHNNILKLNGHVMHQQFNIQQLYALPTLYLCVLYLSENKQRPVPLKS